MVPSARSLPVVRDLVPASDGGPHAASPLFEERGDDDGHEAETADRHPFVALTERLDGHLRGDGGLRDRWQRGDVARVVRRGLEPVPPRGGGLIHAGDAFREQGLLAFQPLDVPVEESAWFDIPGPERLSGRDILLRTAAALGLRPPLMIEVPFLSPRLSSHWVRFVTRAEWSVAREVVVGLKTDLLARDARFWAMIGHAPLQSFDAAALAAIEAERRLGPVPGVWGQIERGLARVRRPPERPDAYR